MKKFLQKRLGNEKGLTLVELLAVIVILGIIAAIAIPAIGNIIENSRVKAIKADALMVLSAADLYFVDNPDAATPVALTLLNSSGYLDDLGLIVGTGSVAKVQTGNTISGKGTSGNVTIQFTDATKKGINAAKDVKDKGSIVK